MKKLLFVYNSGAGKAQIKNYLSGIIDIFIKEDYDVTVRPTQCKLDAYETVRYRAHEFDLIVCSGGDGTLNETVCGIIDAGTNTPLGYIPSGTTNDFASSLSIPKDMLAAAEAIVTGVPFGCDIGRFNDNTFNYIAAFGIFTEVSYQTPQQKKNLLGHLAYVIEGAKSLTNIEPYHMIIEHDGETIEDDFIFGMISNSMSVGGFKTKSELGVKLDDGVFEAVFIKMPRNSIQLQETLKEFTTLKTFEMKSENMFMFRSDKIRITSNELVTWTLDGEFGGHVKDAEVRCMNRAVTIMINGEPVCD